MATDSHGMGIELPADSTKVHQFPGVVRLAMERVAEILAGEMTAEQKAALVAEAEAAVTAELASRDLVTGDDTRLPQAFTGEDGWLEGFADQNQNGLLGFLADGRVEIPNLKAGRINGTAHEGSTEAIVGYVESWTDATGRMVFGVLADGTVEIPRLKAGGTLTGGTDADPAAEARRLTFLGDSMTASGYGNKVGAALATTVFTNAVGGENSSGVAARQGGSPYLMTPAGGSIPGTGGVTVTFKTPSGLVSWPVLQGSALVGTWAGVHGTLSITKVNPGSDFHSDGDTYTFTRTTAGTAVAIPAPKPFYTDMGEDHRAWTHVYWVGTNNSGDFTANGLAVAVDRLEGDLNAMIEHQTGLKRYLVLSITNGYGGGTGSVNEPFRNAYNTRMLQRHGRRYLDTYNYLVDYGLAHAGITPTAQDTEDIAARIVPTSLRQDTIHLNNAGNTVVADLVAERLTELGWA